MQSSDIICVCWSDFLPPPCVSVVFSFACHRCQSTQGGKWGRKYLEVLEQRSKNGGVHASTAAAAVVDMCGKTVVKKTSHALEKKLRLRADSRSAEHRPRGGVQNFSLPCMQLHTHTQPVHNGTTPRAPPREREREIQVDKARHFCQYNTSFLENVLCLSVKVRFPILYVISLRKMFSPNWLVPLFFTVDEIGSRYQLPLS